MVPSTGRDEGVTPATRLRILWDLLTSPPLQQGLGITPGEGQWTRVKSIMALHDETSDNAWVQRWSVGGDWQVGLVRGLGEGDEQALSQNVSYLSERHPLTASNPLRLDSTSTSSRPTPDRLCLSASSR